MHKLDSIRENRNSKSVQSLFVKESKDDGSGSTPTSRAAAAAAAKLSVGMRSPKPAINANASINKKRPPSMFFSEPHDDFYERYHTLDHQRMLNSDPPKDGMMRTVVPIADPAVRPDTSALTSSLEPFQRADALRKLLTSPKFRPAAEQLYNDVVSGKPLDGGDTPAIQLDGKGKPRHGTVTSAFGAAQAAGRSRDGHGHGGVDQLSPIPGRGPGKTMPVIAKAIDVCLSPRSRYIEACMREHLNPREKLLSKLTAKRANLGHMGMGDTSARVFAESMLDMPVMELIDLSDNNITDRGMAPIIKSIGTIKSLSQLDLSHNVIGPTAAKAFAVFLRECSLKQLLVHHCSLTDTACQLIIESLLTERLTSSPTADIQGVTSAASSLIELDLSNNDLCKSHLRNSKGMTTGDIIAKWLSQNDCVLQSFNLSWNTIRLDSGIAITTALGVNRSLTSLNLAYNALGREGGLALGSALLTNKTLRKLNVSNNNIDSVATFTICVGVMESDQLVDVILDGNPIGEKGAAAMMMIPIVRAGSVKVSSKQCNITTKDPDCWFRFDYLPGKYVLKMDDHYERAIAILLLRMVAFHHSMLITRMEHIPKATEKTTGPFAEAISKFAQSKSTTSHQSHYRSKYVPIRVALKSREAQLDDKQRSVARNMRKMIHASSDYMAALRLFNETDMDHNGGITMSELDRLMTSMGITMVDFRLHEIMAAYDSDAKGWIDKTFFLKFVSSMREEIEKHLSDVVNLPVMVWKEEHKPIEEEGDGGDGEDAGEVKQYIPPTKGVLLLEVVDGFMYKEIYRLMPSCDRVYADKIADLSPASDELKEMSWKMTKLRLDDALCICNDLTKHKKSAVHVLSKLLSRMTVVSEARKLLFQVINGDRGEMLKLKKEMGPSLRAILGIPNAHYFLDLHVESDRNCMGVLREFSEINYHKRAADNPLGFGLLGDTSQKGNWSCFRNELFNGRPFVLDDEFLNNMPAVGKVEFDFSGEARPDPNVTVMKDVAVVRVLLKLNLIKEYNVAIVIRDLVEIATSSNLTQKGDGSNSLYECAYDKAVEIGHYHALFYEKLGMREQLLKQAAKHEELIITEKGIVKDDMGRKEKEEEIARLSASNRKPSFYSPPLARRPSMSGSGGSLPTLGSNSKSPADSRHTGVLRSASVANNSLAKKETGKDTLDGAKRNLFSADAARSESSPARMTKLLPMGKSFSKTATAERRGSLSQSQSSAGGADTGDDHLDVPGSADTVSSAFPLDSSGDTTDFGASGNTMMGTSMNFVSPNRDVVRIRGGAAGGEIISGDDVLPLQEDEQPTKGVTFYGVRRGSSAMTSEYTEYLNSVTADQKATLNAKMSRLVDAIETCFGCYKWIRSRHLALILNCISTLPFGMADKTTYFGNYRVEVVVLLFGHIVDLHNFELVLRELSAYETACVIARIGWLNFFNPMKADGSYSLDLGRWDQRMIVKMLAVMETHEPGMNWLQPQFRWTLDSDPVPGWVLTQPWLTEEGLPMRGIMELEYFAGRGVKDGEFQPTPRFRKTLLYNTLIHERDIADEDIFDGGRRQLSVSNAGANAMKMELGMWTNYFVHDMTAEDSAPADAVTAPRRIKNRAQDHNPIASIPVFKALNPKPVIGKEEQVNLPVHSGSINTSKIVKQTNIEAKERRWRPNTEGKSALSGSMSTSTLRADRGDAGTGAKGTATTPLQRRQSNANNSMASVAVAAAAAAAAAVNSTKKDETNTPRTANATTAARTATKAAVPVPGPSSRRGMSVSASMGALPVPSKKASFH